MQEKKSQSSSFTQVRSKIKVVFLGEQSTGKTSILMRFVHDKFQEGIGATIGIDFMAKNIHLGPTILRLQLWDTAGQQRFRSLIPSYLKDASIAFIVFDLTNQKTLDTLHQWIDLCNNNRKEKTIVVLLGNKCDLKEEREVAEDTIKEKIQNSGLNYFEVSAKNGHNIKEALQFAGLEYVNNYVNNNDNTFFSSINSKNEEGFDKKQENEVGSSIKNVGHSDPISLSNVTKKKASTKSKKKGCC